MAKVTISRKAAEQLSAFRTFYRDTEPLIGERAIAAIRHALRRLETHPAVGRPFGEDGDLRELVIPFGRTGYVALYRISVLTADVVVLAIRHQREAGYDNEERDP